MSEASLLNRILLSMKTLTESELLSLESAVKVLLDANYQRRAAASDYPDQEIKARVSLVGLTVSPLNGEIIRQRLSELNEAEQSLVKMAIPHYLRCEDLPEGTTVSIGSNSSLGRIYTSMVPVRATARPNDPGRAAYGIQYRDMLTSMQRNLDAGNKDQALAVLDEFIQFSQRENRSTFRLKLQREFTFFRQPGDYTAIISLCEQMLVEHQRTGNLLGQLDALEIMAFAALRMGQRQRAAFYLNRITTRLVSPDDIPKTTALLGYDSDSTTLVLIQDKLDSARQLRGLLGYDTDVADPQTG